MKWIAGVDEAGRGPLAGPVAIGAVLVTADFDWALIPGVADSKKLSEKKRKAIYARAVELEKAGKLSYAVELVAPKVIDTKGISFAIRAGIAKCLEALSSDPKDTYIKLDGSLKAPPEFVHQKTIIKGDATEKEIGLASIMAKVTRDRAMVRLAKKYPAYGFEVHKGYGTLRHRQSIKKEGLTAVHRTTYCRACQ